MQRKSSELKVLFGPVKDYKFNVGHKCVLNSGSTLLEVTGIESNGNRMVSWVDEDGEIQNDSFPNICLRPHILDLIGIY